MIPEGSMRPQFHSGSSLCSRGWARFGRLRDRQFQRLGGHPGVDLVGVARGKQNYSWSLARRPGRHSKVRLKPGGTAHFNVIYLPSSSGNINSLTVTKMVITPPNAFTQAELTWSPFVLLQESAVFV
jgi:Protein of unknown function (DUF4232)